MKPFYLLFFNVPTKITLITNRIKNTRKQNLKNLVLQYLIT